MQTLEATIKATDKFGANPKRWQVFIKEICLNRDSSYTYEIYAQLSDFSKRIRPARIKAFSLFYAFGAVVRALGKL